MKKTSTIVSIVITAAIIIGVALFTSSKEGDQTVQFSMPVTVKDNEIQTELLNPIYFNPVGETCSFTIDIQGMDDFISNVRITTVSPADEPIYKTSATNATISTGELNVEDKGIFVMIDPELKSGAAVEDNDFLIHYVVILHADSPSATGTMLNIVICLFIVVFAVIMLVMVNRNKQKDYDERQMRARGSAAMNALIVTIIVAFGMGVLARTADSFPLTMYEAGLIICLTGAFTFLINADLNDAFIGMKGRRLPFAIIYTIVGLMQLLMSGFFKLIFKVGFGSELGIVAFVAGIYFTAVGIFMIIKAICEKKEAKEDEES